MAFNVQYISSCLSVKEFASLRHRFAMNSTVPKDVVLDTCDEVHITLLLQAHLAVVS